VSGTVAAVTTPGEPLDSTLTAADLRCRVVTVSTRAAAGVYEDLTGPVIVTALTGLGCAVEGPMVVADGAPVEAALRDAIAAGVDAVVTTGGTGFTPTDRTPERTRAVLDLEIPGIAEALRARGVAGGVQTAVFSRGVVGVAGRTLVVNLPGSRGAVRDGLDVVLPLLVEAVRHLRGSR
jgi:molybdenum cofactor synthesis domain-containing protein